MYNTAYPGATDMRIFDGYDSFRRWFCNYQTRQDACFYNTEWVTVEEESWHVRGKRVTRYVGTIGADHHDHRRRVVFETGAPPPPIFMVPARVKHTPWAPPPGYFEKIARELRVRDALRALAISRLFTPQQLFVAEVLPPVAPPPPRHRRNV